MRPSQQRRRKTVGRIALTLAGLYLLLLIPASNPPEPAASDKQPFVWNKDEYWQALEDRCNNARQQVCEELAPVIEAEFAYGHHLLDSLDADTR
ncbi:hypothetical protein DWB58_31460, partial [candidate division KSB1 bacterium]|nr:hypothetical protein [candidate division KSB1 bacterium]